MLKGVTGHRLLHDPIGCRPTPTALAGRTQKKYASQELGDEDYLTAFLLLTVKEFIAAHGFLEGKTVGDDHARV